MSVPFWQSVASGGMHVPSSRSIDEMTTELGDMLGDPDPQVRDALAYPILATWVERGVYDHLLTRLGNGLLLLIEDGVGEVETDGVFRRSFAALVLAEVVERDNRTRSLEGRTLLAWGERASSWLLTERDLRDHVGEKGWAHAVAHGADLLGALARSPRLRAKGLLPLAEVVALRLLEPTTPFLVAGEPDRLARATMDVLLRDLLTLEDLDPFLGALSAHATPAAASGAVHPFRVSGNVQSFLRALHLQLMLSPDRPSIRADLLLSLTERLQASNAPFLRAVGGHSEPGPAARDEPSEDRL